MHLLNKCIEIGRTSRKKALFFSEKLNVSFQFNVKWSQQPFCWDSIWNGRRISRKQEPRIHWLRLHRHGCCNTNIKAYFDEPIADEAWLDNYRKKREEDRERRKDFELRWDGTKPVSTYSITIK